MPRTRSHAIIAGSAAAVSTFAGIVGGFLANKWDWGIAAGALTLVAVFVGLEGLKAMADARTVPPGLDPARQKTAGPSGQVGADPRTSTSPGSGTRVWEARSIHMRQSIIAENIGSVDLSRKTHVHVGGLAAVVVAVLLLLGTAGSTLTFAVGEGGRLAGETTPPTVDVARYTGLFERVNGPPWLAYFGLTSQQYQQTFDDVAGKGFRLIRVSGYAIQDEERFAPIFEQGNGPPRRAVHGVTSQYQQVFDELTGQGFRVVQFDGYAVRDQEWHTAVFEQSDGPPWLAFHGLTAQQYEQTSADLAGKGFRLVQLSGYAIGGVELLAPIFEQRTGPPTRAFHGLTAEEYQQKSDELTRQGFRVVHFSGYSLAGAERFVAIFEQADGPAGVAFHGLTSQQYQQRFDEVTAQGFRLVQVSGYSVG